MNLYRFLHDHLMHASATDYGVLALSAVIAVWFFVNYKLD
ncbi:hypothetical protein SAMN05421753_10648 [Planctomicrobium piriforme]|uniref:Uncharacterized protein n=1 Tax=Planctomicrobium piriforme TaxID=1576369 RepID=A0A1I3FVP0_9PLAN|nr:hypothetical protein SAMN05421753_10648 [Planctomicrobium piriforme]